MKIEVCINRIEDIKRVQSLSVDRIEFCIELSCGGLTPSLAMVEQALTISHIPIHVLVRPYSGHFVYSDVIIEGMKKTIEQLHDLGVDGIVTGALTKEHQLPLSTLATFRSIVSSGALYFHRAFDEVSNSSRALTQLSQLGYDGVLTSGQSATAIEGMDQLLNWKKIAFDSLTILPGCGINHENCLPFKAKGFEWIHLSAKKRIDDSGNSLFTAPQYELDVDALKKVIHLLKP